MAGPEPRIILLLPGEPGSCWCWCETCGPSKIRVALGRTVPGSPQDRHCRLPWTACRVHPSAN